MSIRPTPRLSAEHTLLIHVAAGVQRIAEKAGRPVPNDMDAIGEALGVIAAYDAERGL